MQKMQLELICLGVLNNGLPGKIFSKLDVIKVVCCRLLRWSMKVTILITNGGGRVRRHFDTNFFLFNILCGTEIWLYCV